MMFADLYRCLNYFVKNSTFSSNYNYLSCKYELSNQDWYLETNHLLCKVRLKSQLNITCSPWQSIIELYEICDGLSPCEALSNDDVCKFIELIYLEYILLNCNELLFIFIVLVLTMCLTVLY